MKINAQEYLNNLTDKSVWVFTKQETNFDTAINATKMFSKICNTNEKIEPYFKKHHLEYNIKTDRHRVLAISQFLGLLTKTPFYKKGSQYIDEKPTAVFDSFNNILITTKGSKSKIAKTKYNTLKTEQILKLKIHAIIDTANNNNDCYILPIIFIYKVLKELQQKYKINEISIDQLYTYVMTCKNHSDYINAVEFIKNNGKASKYVEKYKQNSRILTIIKENIKLFNITSSTISINQKFDDYFYNNFMLKYDFDELSDILHREIDYSYFLYNVQDFNVNLIDIPEIDRAAEKSTKKEVIKNENSDEEYDEDYEIKVDNVNENNVNKNVAIGAHEVPPLIEDETKVSKKYRRNPLLGKIAIQNANYCCEKNKKHITFISSKTNKNFMEAHHLVPIKYQQQIWDRHRINVDCVENILSLCPTCHRAIHNGTNKVRKEIITDLYKKLLPRYKLIKFDITLDEILELYNIK